MTTKVRSVTRYTRAHNIIQAHTILLSSQQNRIPCSDYHLYIHGLCYTISLKVVQAEARARPIHCHTDSTNRERQQSALPYVRTMLANLLYETFKSHRA